MPERLLRPRSATSSRRRHRRSVGVLLVLLLVLAGLVSSYAVIKPLPKPRVSTQALTVAPTPAVAISWPSYGQAAIGAMGYGVLATHGVQTPIATASIAKIMTALAVLQRKPLAPGETGPTITLDQADIDSYNKYASQDGSVVYVVTGEQLTEYQALQAMLLPSANNIADTLARWAFGSIDNYLAYANDYAAKQGWTGLHFSDASGFAATTTGTASDLTQLGEQALQNATISDIVGQSSATIPIAGTVHNVNAVLGDEGIIGLKTGNNDADPGAFLFAAKRQIGDQTVTVVGTILGGSELRSTMLDSLPLIRSAASNFTTTAVAPAGQVVGSVQVPWQAASQLTTDRQLSLLAWGGQTVTASIKLQTISLPLSRHATVGSLTASAGQTATNTTDIQAAADIKPPSFWWRLQHVFSD